ncbi:TetR family transcriptional regulator [Spirillospora sp. CA-294931]|uniref:TetR family transcriptional regulator n=1 Tax=Spirillospora sp. CA-294931 TaxID=3240042 RepID=UPI003D8A4771
MDETTRSPRRAPRSGERKQDAERSRRLLLEAAKEEFAAKGFAGARVQDIADRAGVNKQLINYYFGGKEGLYCELGRRWLEWESEISDPGIPLGELWERYLAEAMADGRGLRLAAWRGLTEELDAIPDDDSEDLADLTRRKADGELAEDLEVEAVMAMMNAMVVLPVVMPNAIRRIYGMDPRSPEFYERYAAQMRRIIAHLAP